MRKTGIENEKDGIENECGCFGRSFDGYMVVEQAENEREPFFSALGGTRYFPAPGERVTRKKKKNPASPKNNAASERSHRTQPANAART